MANTDFNFETALEDLNLIVTKLEQGGLGLEDCLLEFEKGIALTRKCQEALNQAEQKVQSLIERNGELTLKGYQLADEDK